MKNFSLIKGGWVKLRFLFLLLIFPFSYQSIYAKTGTVNERLLIEVLDEISRDHHVYFTYDADMIKGITVDYEKEEGENVRSALSRVLAEVNMDFRIFEERFVIIYRQDQDGLKSLEEMIRHMEMIVSDKKALAEIRKVRPVNKLETDDWMGLYRKRLILNVTGRVVDSDGNPLIGVNILVKDSNKGTTTDFDGRFLLNDVSDQAILVFSYIGYKTEEVAINGRTTLTIIMQEDAQTLDEVVVVGYGTQKRSDLTGSLVSVGSDKISEVPVASSVASALQGRMAGVEIQSTSSRPGGDTQIRIRGNRSLASDESGRNDPLIVLDGIPYSGSITDINPGVIESVNVLKDASATAIYGSRGANGVILITTKRGKPGEAQVTYSGYHGISSPLDHYDLFNAEEYADLKQVSNFQQKGGFFTKEEKENMLRGHSTDWQDLLYKNGYVSNHDVNISGGSEKTNYSFGGGYFKQTTVLPGQAYQRFSLRTSIDQDIGQRLTLGLSSMNNLSVRDGENVSPMFQMLTLSPLYSAYDENGQINRYPAAGSIDENTVNPLELYRDNSFSQTRKRLRTFNSLYGEVKILENLRYRLNVGLDYWQEEYGSFNSAFTPMNNGTNQNQNSASIRNRDLWSYTLENIITYDESFGLHSFNFTGLYSVQEEESNSSGADANAIYADYIQYYNFNLAGNYNIPDGAFGYSRWGLMSMMGRINYNFDDRYLATFTLRGDGSSRLADDNKWFIYPAAALGWNVHNEKFLENASFLSNLKLRLGWGRTSNQAVAPYASLGRLGRQTYSFGDRGYYGFLVTNLPNANLEWEFTTSSNIGLDFGFLSGRINGSIELYKTHTTGVLQDRRLAVTAGVPGSFTQNIGETEGKGLEVMLGGQIIEQKNRNDFGWNLDLNFTTHQEKILQLTDPSVKEDINNGWFVGHPVNVIYDYKKIGIWQLDEKDEAAAFGGYLPGDVKVADINGNGIRDADDRVILGQMDPKWTAGLTTRFAYKGFDLSAVLYARYGGMLVSTLYQARVSYPINSLEGRRNGPKVDYWTEDNPTNEFPRTGLQDPKFGSTLGYFDASYMKIRTINLGYTLPDNWMDNAGISNVRIYLTADNPFKAFFSEYVRKGGIDPEPTGRDGDTPTPGLGRRLVVTPDTPVTKTFLLGVNLTF